MHSLEKHEKGHEQDIRSEVKRSIKPLQRLVTEETLKKQLTQFKKSLTNFSELKQLPRILANYNNILVDFVQHVDERLKSGPQPSWWEQLLKAINPNRDIKLSSSITGLLKRCIEQLPEMENVVEQRKQLLKLLSTKVMLRDLPDLLKQLSFLIVTIFADYVRTQQDFLENVNQRLADFHEFLQKVDNEEKEKQENTEHLSTTIHDQINEISNAFSTTDTIEKLQSLVENRLENIGNAIDKYQAFEASRMQSMVETIATMQDRLLQHEQSEKALKKALDEARGSAKIDVLTGLFNRQAYDEHLDLVLSDVKENDTSFSLIVADIDYFKNLNDNHGHAAGDKMLRIMGNLCRDHMRENDFVARYGGEEIAFIIKGDQSVAYQAAEKLRQVVASWKFPYQDRLLEMTISMGVTQLQAEDTAETVFARSDECLYQAKGNGRNMVVVA